MVLNMLVRHLGIVSGICSLLGAQWNLGATSRISGRRIRVADLSRYVLHSSLLVGGHSAVSAPLARERSGLCGGRWNRLRHDLSLGPFWFLRRG